MDLPLFAQDPQGAAEAKDGSPHPAPPSGVIRVRPDPCSCGIQARTVHKLQAVDILHCLSLVAAHYI